MMFAGHHTTSGTAAWTLIELLRHPDELAAVVGELDALEAARRRSAARRCADAAAGGGDQGGAPPAPAADPGAARREQDLEVEGYRIAAGKLVGVSLSVSNRLPDAFPSPTRSCPSGISTPRAEDLANPWNWIPFGAGRHRCVGAAFAMMQLKAIFSLLLRDWTFELEQPPDTYRNDHSKMVVQLAQPCVARYRRRERAR